MRAEMKSFAERNRLAIGTVGIVVVAAVALAALQYQRLPFFNQGTRVSAYFADAGGLRTGNTVEVSGYPVGKVSSISLDGPGVLVEFKVDTDVRLGNRTEVAIKTKGLLGSKFLDVTPRGDGRLDSPIPIERTTSPYQLPDALGDLAATISGLHTERLSESLATLAQTFADTPAHFRNAIHGVARLAQTLDERDNQLRTDVCDLVVLSPVLTRCASSRILGRPPVPQRFRYSLTTTISAEPADETRTDYYSYGRTSGLILTGSAGSGHQQALDALFDITLQRIVER